MSSHAGRGLYPFFFRRLLLPVGEGVYGSHIGRSLARLEASQWWSANDLRDQQDEALRRLIRHAYANVPYYCEVFRGRRLRPQDIRTVDDLPKLPVLTKAEIRRDPSRFLSKDFSERRTVRCHTGGTTGEPLQYSMDLDAWSLWHACNWRGWEFAGYRPGDRMVTFGGSSLIPDTSPSLLKRAFWKFHRNELLSAVHLSPQDLDRCARYLAQRSPGFIRGYPSALAVLADFIGEHAPESVAPVAVFTTAEALQPAYRRAIENSLRCKVYDNYGCGDGGGNAMQCEVGDGYHVASERAILEICEAGEPVGSGKMGEMVWTDLHNYVMPFIRYAVGDQGTWAGSPCRCGRGLPLLNQLHGRLMDRMTFRGGIVLSGPASTLMFQETGFLQYQLEQVADARLMVRVVRRGSKPAQDLRDREHVMRALTSHLGPDIEVVWEFVDRIPGQRGGKLRFFIALAGEDAEDSSLGDSQ